VWLTAKAQRMRKRLLTLARGITEEAEAGISRSDLLRFRRVVARMTANLDCIKR
jgi:DNA-binding MarR family transcriptional regulator